MKKTTAGCLAAVLLGVFLAGCASTGGSAESKTVIIKKGKTQEATAAAANEDKKDKKDTVLGFGDSITIEVYQHDDFKKSVTIDSSGIVMMPLIGDVTVTGRSIFQLRDELQQKLSRVIVNPQVMVSITETQSRKIMVMGEVNGPGTFPLEFEIRISEALARAGGITDDGKTNDVLLVRRLEGGDVEITHLNFKNVYKQGDYELDKYLRNGDIVYVPPKRIAALAQFMTYISQIISPIVSLETGIALWPEVESALKGEGGGSTFSISAD